jgi:sporulation protein YlmC with PRC-barrel domain
MLRSLKDLERYKVSASDGDIGSVVNFLFDDERWAVRYLVVDSGGFFSGRRVLISPISFGQADWSTRRFHVALTMDKVKNSPSIDADRPVSRQHERDYYGYYGYPYYWGYGGLWGMGLYPGLLATGRWDGPAAQHANDSDVHLRSADEVRGYHIQGSDDAIGHVDDLIVDDETWAVRYLVVDTSNWWFGKKVLIAPAWASSVSWYERKVHLAMTRQAIKDSPEWNASSEIERDFETRLYDYYGRPVYWKTSNQPGIVPPLHASSHH